MAISFSAPMCTSGARVRCYLGGSVRLLLGLLLITAALLKAYDLLWSPASHFGSQVPLWLTSLWAVAELGIGLWFLIGGFSAASWYVVLGCFACFSVVQLYQIVSGAESCGCFGPVRLSPWWLFPLDALSICGLCYFRRVLVEVGEAGRPSGTMRRIAIASVFIPALSSAALGTVLFLAISKDRRSGTVAGVRVFDPVRSLGKRLALLDSIDVGGDLSQGDWTAVLYSSGCSHCREVLSRFDVQQARQHSQRVAFIEIPPFQKGAPGERTYPGVVHGRLGGPQTWFIQVPVVLKLRNGYVVGQLDKPYAGQKQSPADQDWFAFGRAVGEQVSQTEGSARLLSASVSPNILHDVISGGSYMLLAELESRHSEPVKIDSMRADCSCTVPMVPREVLVPGGTLRTSVLYRPKGVGLGSVGVLVASRSGKAVDFSLLRVRHHSVEQFSVTPESFVVADKLPALLAHGADWTIQTANADWRHAGLVVASHLGLSVQLHEQQVDKARRTYRLTLTPSAGLTSQSLRPMEVICVWFANDRTGQFARLDLSLQGGEAQGPLPWPILYPQVLTEQSGVSLPRELLGATTSVAVSASVLDVEGKSQPNSIPGHVDRDSVRWSLPSQLRSSHVVLVVQDGSVRTLVPVSLDGVSTGEL